MKTPLTSKQVLNVACWNVRTMLDKADSSRRERRSALVPHELSRFSIDITTLSEVHLADEGSLMEHSTGYTLCWSGKLSTERCLSGVGLMVRNSIASRLDRLSTGHSDCFMSMLLPLEGKQHLTLFTVYAPALLADTEEKDIFYSDLRRLLTNIPEDNKVLILGNLNTRVGKDSKAWQGVLGRHSVGNCNDNGRLLLKLCGEHQLAITNTIFHQKDSLKTSWMQPQSKHWHLLDYVLVRKWDLKDVLLTRVMPSEECHTDHCLVRCKLRLQFKPKHKKKGNPNKKLNVSLCWEEVKAKFQADLLQILDESPCRNDPSPNIPWENLKSAVLKTSEEVFGHKKKKKQRLVR